MATWTPIPNSSLEPGAPARSFDALALRDNPIALAEGASGAPRIVNNAVGPYQLSDDRMMKPSPGALVQMLLTKPGVEVTSSVPQSTSIASFGVNRSGRIKIAYEHGNNTNGQTSTVGIYRNDALVFSNSVSSEAFQVRSVDVDIFENDYFEIKLFNDDTTGVGRVKNARIQVDYRVPMFSYIL